MQECPKCGFVQPKDRYCANCGMDIEAYRPAPPSVWLKMRRNGPFRLALLLLVTLILASIVYVSQRDRLNQSLLEASKQDFSPSNKRPRVVVKQNAFEDSPQDSTDETSYDSGDQDKTEVATPVSGTALTEPSTVPENETPVSPTNLSVDFYESPRAWVQLMVDQSQLLGEFGDIQGFALAEDSLQALLGKENAPNSLNGGNSQSMTANNPIELDFMQLQQGNPPTESGFRLEITPTSISGKRLDLQIRNRVSLKNETGALLNSTDMNANFSLLPNTALIIVGLLPHNSVRRKDQDNFDNTPLEIYKSADFVSGNSELIILIRSK